MSPPRLGWGFRRWSLFSFWSFPPGQWRMGHSSLFCPWLADPGHTRLHRETAAEVQLIILWVSKYITWPVWHILTGSDIFMIIISGRLSPRPSVCNPRSHLWCWSSPTIWKCHRARSVWSASCGWRGSTLGRQTLLGSVQIFLVCSSHVSSCGP